MGGLEMKKRTVSRYLGDIMLALAAILAAQSCYAPYVKDYQYNGVYIAYQYDLRTFVVGEGMKFKLTAALGGVLKNDRDRKVYFEIDPSIVNGSLTQFWPGVKENISAYSEITGETAFGKISQPYVSEELVKAGIGKLTPLPRSTYYLSDDEIVIRQGRVTGSVTVEADSLALLSLPYAGKKPYYAIGFRILHAEADTVLLSKSYQICAVRCENLFYGNWYHGGETTVLDSNGRILEVRHYPTRIPSDQTTPAVYTLSTAEPNSVTTNYIGDSKGSIKLIWNGDFVKVVSNDSHKVVDMESTFNREHLLQNRQIYLNYSYDNADGTTCVVKDTLTFRNRIRDGVNEWQDTNINHYNED